MLTFPAPVRIWLCIEPVDMRLSFRGLSGIVRGRLRDNPLSGHLFCFINARKTMMKLLFYDRTGYWIFHKRLSQGTFQFPACEPGSSRVALDAGDLSLILEGIDLRSVLRRKRYHPPHPEPLDA